MRVCRRHAVFRLSTNLVTPWAGTCPGKGETTLYFDGAGALTETVLPGTIGIRFSEQELTWDARTLKIMNHDQAQERVIRPYRTGWEPSWV